MATAKEELPKKAVDFQAANPSMVLDKKTRQAFGIFYSIDVVELSEQMLAAILYELHNNYLFFLEFHNLFNLLKNYLELYQPKSQHGIVESYFRAAVPGEIKLIKPLMDQVFPTKIADPQYLEGLDRLSPFVSSGILFREYKILNYKYENTRSDIYYTGYVNQINLVHNFLDKIENATHISDETKDVLKKETRELVELLSPARRERIEEEYKNDCLQKDTNGNLVPDFKAMAKRAAFFEQELHELTETFEKVIDKIGHIAIKEVDELKQGFNAAKTKIKEDLEIASAFFEPLLEEQRIKLIASNKEIVNEVNDDLENFDNFLKQAIFIIKEDQDKELIVQYRQDIKDLQIELNKGSHDFEKIQELLAKCHYAADNLSPLFASDQILHPLRAQFDSMLESLAFKANWKLPESPGEFMATDHNVMPKFTHILNDELDKFIKEHASAPPWEEISAAKSNSNIEAQTQEVGHFKTDLIQNNEAELLINTTETSPRSATEQIDSPQSKPIDKKNSAVNHHLEVQINTQHEFKKQIQHIRNLNTPEHERLCQDILTVLNGMDDPNILPKTKISIDNAKNAIFKINSDGFTEENYNDLLKILNPLSKRNEDLFEYYSELTTIEKSLNLPPTGMSA